ncbi:OLC1v1006251C1 [Oldenlandia corymbosa var. corymbosa]|uniref:OLC1v1006251C1 n=1 Tax=Oldenlandia corymbosa var. corymbosa TaxID=529605 RepID=A0AAV1DGM2_OLDCO|nr:OLC1v1006251C1 [Oldenlandia corymbosa var. corymbosa]
MTQTDSEVESYPPLFRPKKTLQTTDDIKLDHATFDNSDESNQPTNSKVLEFDSEFDPLPVIDFKSLNNTKLDEACREWGMFRLINHGIPMTLLNQLHTQARQVLSLPFEYKQASFTPPMSYFWGTPGLTPSGVAITRPQNLNWIEGFHVLLSPLPQLLYEDPLLDSFRSILDEYGRHQRRVATTMLEAMAINLQLDPMRTKSYLSPGTGHLRVHRYPRCFDQYSDDVPPQNNDDHHHHQAQPQQHFQARWGIDVHTDSSILSILHQDDVGGLQVYNTSDHQWFNVKPQFDSLIVNLGDMMQVRHCFFFSRTYFSVK